VCSYIDANQEVYIQRLSEAVAIQSVSGWPEARGEVTRMVQYVAKVCAKNKHYTFDHIFARYRPIFKI